MINCPQWLFWLLCFLLAGSLFPFLNWSTELTTAAEAGQSQRLTYSAANPRKTYGQSSSCSLHVDAVISARNSIGTGLLDLWVLRLPRRLRLQSEKPCSLNWPLLLLLLLQLPEWTEFVLMWGDGDAFWVNLKAKEQEEDARAAGLLMFWMDENLKWHGF